MADKVAKNWKCDACEMPSRTGYESHVFCRCCSEESNQNEFDCRCEFTTDSKDGDDDWHYDRKCLACGGTWRGLHCPHDGFQTPCPHCGVLPVTLRPRGAARG